MVTAVLPFHVRDDPGRGCIERGTEAEEQLDGGRFPVPLQLGKVASIDAGLEGELLLGQTSRFPCFP